MDHVAMGTVFVAQVPLLMLKKNDGYYFDMLMPMMVESENDVIKEEVICVGN
jgi:hypothetical protein